MLHPALPTDAPAIAALVRAAYAKWIPVLGREPQPMTVDYAQAMKLHRFDLAWEGETLAGLIETRPEGPDLMIVNLAVAPAFQGRGLGRRLLLHAETLAAAAGLKATRLYTNQLMAANVALYRALGYVVEREAENPPYGVRVDMVKALARSPSPARG